MNEDIRIYKTKIAIERALIELLQQHDFKDITIKKICDQSLIGRSTFYSHYLDKYDLLEKIVKQYASDFKVEIKQRFDSTEDGKVANAIELVTDNMIKNKLEISTLLAVHEVTADLRKEFEQILFRTCLDYLKQQNSSTSIALEYLAELYAANSMMSIQWVLKNGKDANIILLLDQMQEYIFNQLKSDLYTS
ncbi:MULTISPECIES: TetR/AcrR family transcriptional regulator [Paenibacillus]|jgi:AcrR family transcriptional regulator|uniref:Transcriptional regulator n=3 Tax=Paenibacillus TaxID=44249 RepID=A0ABX2ZGA0_PAEPO|nr:MULTISPECIES: TetR family transcriptional regulator [Paenibacillus]APB76075.1 TetR/AcrR family transcriptional regulator [Paenibacillus polymyxa]MDR6780874.1 AcrR family transcriptional regulator [Paenibacillus peoriae]ODA09321.1 transcriptional regulator [Paenibacillus polymyxa]OME65070.1 TetR family transcriptional regulator [Paenibacillus peoriae]OMF66789.1 TetR family transcriptional regulator [Paenibacillus peoriae]